MSDRFSSLTVVLDGEYTEEDLETLMRALRCMRGVVDVLLPTPEGFDERLRMSRLRFDTQQKIVTAVREIFGNGL